MKEKENVRESGAKAENYFLSLLNQKGIPVRFKDDWFDFLIYNSIKVEVKSCQLSVRDFRDRLRPGRFDFENEEQLEQVRKENVWVALVLRHHDGFLLVGFVPGRKWEKRYVALHQVRLLKPLCFDEWLERVEQERVSA